MPPYSKYCFVRKYQVRTAVNLLNYQVSLLYAAATIIVAYHTSAIFSKLEVLSSFVDFGRSGSEIHTDIFVNLKSSQKFS